MKHPIHQMKHPTYREMSLLLVWPEGFLEQVLFRSYGKSLEMAKKRSPFLQKKNWMPQFQESLRNDPLYVRARGIVPSVKEFDASFFGLNPKVASAMDPQQRLFLEIAWEALEQAGIYLHIIKVA